MPTSIRAKGEHSMKSQGSSRSLEVWRANSKNVEPRGEELISTES
jgi:hypothetical protein